VKKFLTFAGIAFLVFFVVVHPSSAAAVTKTIGSWLVAIANGFATFFSSLF
jgi:hypothetical protein